MKTSNESHNGVSLDSAALARKAKAHPAFSANDGKIALATFELTGDALGNKLFAIKMKITDVLRAEHAVFHNLFDHIEAAAPKLKTLAEVKSLAAVIEKVHAPHSKTEDDLFIEPLEPYFDQMGQRETFHAEHEHIEGALARVQAARTVKDAKKILLNAIAASRKHFDKEERIVFPLAERILKAKTLNDLGEEWLNRRQVGK